MSQRIRAIIGVEMLKNETRFTVGFEKGRLAAKMRLFALTVFWGITAAAVLTAPASAQRRLGPPISPESVIQQQAISPPPPPPPLEGPPPISAPFAGN
jgi:hypothetical protein